MLATAPALKSVSIKPELDYDDWDRIQEEWEQFEHELEALRPNIDTDVRLGW